MIETWRKGPREERGDGVSGEAWEKGGESDRKIGREQREWAPLSVPRCLEDLGYVSRMDNDPFLVLLDHSLLQFAGFEPPCPQHFILYQSPSVLPHSGFPCPISYSSLLKQDTSLNRLSNSPKQLQNSQNDIISITKTTCLSLLSVM